MYDLDGLIDEFHQLLQNRDLVLEEIYRLQAEARKVEDQSLDESVKRMYRAKHIETFLDLNHRLMDNLKESNSLVLKIRDYNEQ